MERFDDAAALLAYVKEIADDADREVEPWQLHLVPGDVVARYEYGVLIISEIVEPSESRPHTQHFRSTRSYTETSPEGVCEDIHLDAALALVSPKLFKKLKAAGWRVS